MSSSRSSSSSPAFDSPASAEFQPLLSKPDANELRIARRKQHAARVGIANMATGFTIGGLLTMLYSVVEKFRAGPSPVPPPFNFIIFPILGILGLIAAGLSIAEAVLNPTRANIRNAIFNTGDGLATAGIIAASLALPAVIIPIIPYVFMAIMGIQLIKKVYEIIRSVQATRKETDLAKKSGLKQVTAIHVSGATSFALGIISVAVVMLFAHFAMASIGIVSGVFLSAFMGVLIGKTLYDKHKAKKAGPVIQGRELTEMPGKEPDLSPAQGLTRSFSLDNSGSESSYTTQSSQSSSASASTDLSDSDASEAEQPAPQAAASDSSDYTSASSSRSRSSSVSFEDTQAFVEPAPAAPLTSVPATVFSATSAAEENAEQITKRILASFKTGN